MNIRAPSIATTNNTNDATGIIAAWATVFDGSGNAQWAINSTNAANGPITAYTGYSTTWAAGNNVSLASTGTDTLGAGTTTVNTLRISTGGGSAYNLDIGAGNTLAINGSGLLYAGADPYEIKNGTLKATNAAGSELILNNSGAGLLTVSSVIANNTSASALTITGLGTTLLSGANTFTGATYIGQGTVKLGSSTIQGTSGPLGTGVGNVWVNNGAILDLNSKNLNAAASQRLIRYDFEQQYLYTVSR